MFLDVLASLPPQSDFFGTIIYIIQSYYKIILYGLSVTILLSVVGTFGGFILAMGVTQARVVKIDVKRDPVFVKIYKAVFRQLAIVYVTIFRGTPMIVQAMIIYYGIASAGIFAWWSPLPAGLIIVTINTTAYISEVLRGGLQAVDPGQMEAARTLGMSHRQAMRKVMWPQAIKNALPGVGNEFVVNLKDTAVLSVISVVDLFYSVRQGASATYRYYESFMIAAILYLMLTYLSSKLVDYLSKRLDTTAEVNA
ncbi:amino acid ABC transporter permease [Paracholeplasma manati]|uniref:Amino acid ABC transporter permease n=1 Tax=Paracholeplasma manati TaxID=591373 RepID=A0ABT2Y7B0_9MOLU|nr:amino acid ABC transporter permease [Paracholeplasma manati]MCV2232367.1 amino acid ABC transporter permease [Paracholeplasma manati]MDG0888048.1 amino acid ABC transporter permease [Paracholeplasma manati]